VKLFRAHPEDVVGALLLPSPRRGNHDAMTTAAALEGEQLIAGSAAPQMLGLDADAFIAPAPRRRRDDDGAMRPMRPSELERRLADLAGVTPPPAAAHDDDREDLTPAAGAGALDYNHRLLRGAQIFAVGAVLAIAIAAMLSAKYGSGGLHVHQLPLALWGLGAAICAVAAAAVGGDAQANSPGRPFGSALLVALLTCVSGVTASAGGLSGPTWVLFFPVVLVCGAVSGPLLGLLVGAAASAGIYVAAGLSHTLTVTGVGHLVVLLPAAPAAGWAAGALSQLARQAAADADRRRADLERDVRQLAEVLEAVAEGDLSQVPAPGDTADPVATSLAVVFADTLLALRRLVRQMNQVADQLASSAGELSVTAEQTVRGVEAQTSAVAETTSTVEELAATAGSIADIAVRVARFAGSTRRDVDAGADAVRAAGAAMEEISRRVDALADRAGSLRERIEKVGDATKLIDDISRRTTILAVNAAIEAARAGEHGRGFSTVAAEVETLAGRAQQATAQIADILAELERQAAETSAASAEGMAAVEAGAARQVDVVAALQRITTMVDHTTAAAREISEATRQQRFASDAVVTAMATVSTSSDRYREGSHGHAAAARRMHDLAETLKDTLSRFRVG